MSEPERDVTPAPSNATTPEEVTVTVEPVAEEKPKRENPRITWRKNFNVQKEVDIATVDRLTIKAGINQYKGNTLVFLAKVTDKDFSRQFFSMPAWVWEKAIEVLKTIIPEVAEVEKKAMAEAVAKELARLKELGIDISTVVDLAGKVKPEE